MSQILGSNPTAGVHWQRNVKLGEMNLHTERSQPGNVRSDRWNIRIEHRYVHLQSNAVDGNSSVAEIFDHGVDRV
jgi:hypothetical protein